MLGEAVEPPRGAVCRKCLGRQVRERVDEPGDGLALVEEIEPHAVGGVPAFAGHGGQDTEQKSSDLSVSLGRADERCAVRVPEPGRSLGGGRQREQFNRERDILGGGVALGGLGQATQIRGHRRVRRQTAGDALKADPPELGVGGIRGNPGGQGAGVLSQRLRGQRAGQGELQERGALGLLVDGQSVRPLGRARLTEAGRCHGGVLRREECAGSLLVERRQEVRHRPGQLLGEPLEALPGVTGLGHGLSTEPLDVLDQVQRVVPVRRVVDQRPGREAQRLLADHADPDRLGRCGEAEELHRQVLGGAQCVGGQPHDCAAR